MKLSFLGTLRNRAQIAISKFRNLPLIFIWISGFVRVLFLLVSQTKLVDWPFLAGFPLFRLKKLPKVEFTHLILSFVPLKQVKLAVKFSLLSSGKLALILIPDVFFKLKLLSYD